jgi:hypothetical protein
MELAEAELPLRTAWLRAKQGAPSPLFLGTKIRRLRLNGLDGRKGCRVMKGAADAWNEHSRAWWRELNRICRLSNRSGWPSSAEGRPDSSPLLLAAGVTPYPFHGQAVTSSG